MEEQSNGWGKPFTGWTRDCPERLKPLLVNERKICYCRADYDGYRWWNRWFPTNVNLEPEGFGNEVDGKYNMFRAAFLTLTYLRHFIHNENLEADPRFDENRCWYTVYMETQNVLYEFRMQPDHGDYNLYLSAYAK